MSFRDTAHFDRPAWAAGHEDYFSQRVNPARANMDPDYAAGADYAAEDDAQYQEELAIDQD